MAPMHDAVYDNIPPNSVEAEESVLASCLMGHTRDVMELLNESDFYKVAHRKIFAAIKQLHFEGASIDLITLVNRLRDQDNLDSCGGAVSISRLIDNYYPQSPADHAQIVKDKAVIRELLKRAMSIVARCYRAEDAQAIVDESQKEIMSVSLDESGGCAVSVGECLVDVLADIEKLGDNPSHINGVTTGFTAIDWVTCGMQPSDLIVLAGRPSMGKTALAFNIAEKCEVPCVFFSLEMSAKQLTARSLAGHAGINTMRLKRGGMKKADWEALINAGNKIGESEISIDDTSSVNHQYVTRQIRKHVHAGARLAIIDYLQIMGCPGKDRRDLELGQITGALKASAKECGIPILLLSQLNRGLEQREDKRPRLSDLRDSGAIEQDADLVWLLYRDEVYNTAQDNPLKGVAELHIAKHRNGPCERIPLKWDAAKARFYGLSLEGGAL